MIGSQQFFNVKYFMFASLYSEDVLGFLKLLHAILHQEIIFSNISENGAGRWWLIMSSTWFPSAILVSKCQIVSLWYSTEKLGLRQHF